MVLSDGKDKSEDEYDDVEIDLDDYLIIEDDEDGTKDEGDKVEDLETTEQQREREEQDTFIDNELFSGSAALTKPELEVVTSEIVKEYAFKHLNAEVPYALTFSVKCDMASKTADVVYGVNKKGQKVIVEKAMSKMRKKVNDALQDLEAGWKLGGTVVKIKRNNSS